MKIFPLSTRQKLQENMAKRRGILIRKAVPLSKQEQVKYRKTLLDLVGGMREDINATLNPMLERLQSRFVTGDVQHITLDASFSEEFDMALKILRARWLLSDVQARNTASGVVGAMDTVTAARLAKSVGQNFGVDLVKSIRTEGIEGALNASIVQNTRLIKSIPEQYLDQIETIVQRETIKGQPAGSIIKQIREVHKVSVNRARVIARDQSNKINGDITRERQKALGIRAFRWRTVGDDNVRDSHAKRNGKVYAWSPEFVGQKLADGTVLLDPNKDGIGFAGEEIQCRCIAEAILELDRL